MNAQSNSTSLFLVCVNNAGYPTSLELYKIYRVLADDDARQDGDVQAIDESGEDYLYPATHFVPIKVPEVVEQALLTAA